MSFIVEWLVPERVIYSRLEGDVRYDLANFDNAMITLIEASSQPQIHGVTDIRHVTSYAALADTMKLKCIRHPKVGWMISVGAIQNPVFRMMATVTLALVRSRYREAQSLEEAFEFLEHRVPGLSDLKTIFAEIAHT